jgi:alkanesulfonate monooxygenase SsuD/methylene tetrahydromethanopterin reductase-like flavin-dependent oxidoreductase (luciferase family)
VYVRPLPFRQRVIPVHLGGSSPRAARLAARIGDGFEPVRRDLLDAYLRECRKLGREPGWHPGPGHGRRSVHVARDPDAVWDRIKRFAKHDNDGYLAWLKADAQAAGYQDVSDPDDLRRSGDYQVVTPEQFLGLARGLGPDAELHLHPLMGGMDPQAGWDSLRLFHGEVMPRLAEEGLLRATSGAPA